MDSYKDTVVIGIKGRAGSGKTTLGRYLKYNLAKLAGLNNTHIDQLAFAQPLYELKAIKRDIVGNHAYDRKLYAVEGVLHRLLGTNPLYGSPSYEDMQALVKEITHLPIGEDKSRNFLLDAAKKIRSHEDGAFVNDMERTIQKRYRIFTEREEPSDVEETFDAELDDKDGGDRMVFEADQFVVVISDVRYEIEGEFIKQFPRSVIIELECDIDTLRQRSAENEDYSNYLHTYSVESQHMDWNMKPDVVFNSECEPRELLLEVAKYLKKEVF